MQTRRVLVVGALAAIAHAQVEQPGDVSEGRQNFRNLLAQADQLEPARRLGMRAVLHLALHAVIPDVVIVPDEYAYLAAIEAWGPNHFFPILIDDGTDAAREDIARFVRAFEPRSVVRWTPAAPVPADARERRRAIEIGIARAWNIDDPLPTWAAIIERWLSYDLTPPGIILTHENDPAWTAAVALAAARAQPIVWTTGDQGHAGAKMPFEDAARLAARIEAELQALGLSWQALGDDIDAITICLDLPTKIEPREGELLATTDAFGRAGPEGTRWAWCSQIHGDSPRAAYMAMCALFLQPRKAWLFDAYANEGAFADWDATKAADILRGRAIEIRLFDEGAAGAGSWRHEAAAPIDADLIFVNTQGNRDFFELRPGRVFPGDVPFLARPALVHFVHSWSANAVSNRDTVAGRWLERGCFGYLGSVQEPYLQAFVPTPGLAARLIHGYPWGAAVRLDSAPPWKLALFGDPLYVINPLRRADDPLPLESTQSLEDLAREALKADRFAEAASAFVVLGRDADVLRLVMAMLNDRPDAVTPELLHVAVPAAFRLARHDDVRRLLAKLPPRSADAVLQDMLWLGAMPQLATTTDEALLTLLRANLREGQLAEDAVALAPAIARVQSGAAATALLADVRARVSTKRDERTIDEAIRSLGGS